MKFLQITLIFMVTSILPLCLVAQNQKKDQPDTIYYSSEFNFSFFNTVKSDSLKVNFSCSNDYFYYFPKRDGAVFVREYYKDGTVKGQGKMEPIGPYEKIMEDVAYVSEPVYDKSGKITHFKEKTETHRNKIKLYYIEKSGIWFYFDWKNGGTVEKNHQAPKDPRVLIKKRIQEFNKRCREHKKNFPNARTSVFRTF